MKRCTWRSHMTAFTVALNTSACPLVLGISPAWAAGTITEFPVPAGSNAPIGITSAPDDNLWFAEFYGDKIGRITTQ